jgi:hypothetical protein
MEPTFEPAVVRRLADRIAVSNSRRLAALDGHGIDVVVDARAVLEFVFERTLRARTAREFQACWVRSVARFLDVVERDLPQDRVIDLAALVGREIPSTGSSTAIA